MPSDGVVAGWKKSGDKQRTNIEDVQAKFIEAHGDYYGYSKMVYIRNRDNVEIICKKHGIFNQTPATHRKGSGCPRCGWYGFNPLAPAIMFYIKVEYDGLILYKIGITNRSVVERFGPDMKYITVLKTWDYPVGADAYAAEQAILTINKEHRYNGSNILKSGNTELFTVDIGGLDELSN